MKKKIIVGLGAIGIVVTGFFLAPDIAQNYAESKYNLDIEKTTIHLDRLTFHNVSFERDNVYGKFDTVVIDWSKSVRANGGYINVNVTNSKSQNKQAKQTLQNDIQIHDLNLRIVKNNIRVTLDKASIIKNKNKFVINFDNLNKARYNNYSFRFGNGWYNIKTNDFYVNKVLTDIKIDHRYIRPSALIIGQAFGNKNKKQVVLKEVYYYGIDIEKVKLSKNDLINIDAENITILNDLLSSNHLHLESAKLSTKNFKHIKLHANNSEEINIDLLNYSMEVNDSCLNIARALPSVYGLKSYYNAFSGHLQGKIAVHPEPELWFEQDCDFKCSSEPIASLVSDDGFSYGIVTSDGKETNRIISPSHDDWVSLKAISPYIIYAVTTLEDPGFNSHNGVSQLSLKMSLIDNIKKGEIVRGGSTITMQLAKNLWLNREKALIRKAHEIFLAFALESCFTKDRILEYYLNVVEFGPDIYGIKKAAKYYFDKLPYALTPVESFYLAMILPNPQKAQLPEYGGLKKAENLMNLLIKRGFITSDMVQ